MKYALLASLMAGWLKLCTTLTIKSLPVVPDEAIGHLKELIPTLPIGSLAAMVQLSRLYCVFFYPFQAHDFFYFPFSRMTRYLKYFLLPIC